MKRDRFEARVTTNIEGLRMIQLEDSFTQDGHGGRYQSDTLEVLTNPTNDPRDFLVQIVGPGGAIRGSISLHPHMAATLADWLTMMAQEPPRFGTRHEDAGAISDLENYARRDAGYPNLVDIIDGRGFQMGFEVGPPPNTVRTQNGVLVERVNTLPHPTQEA